MQHCKITIITIYLSIVISFTGCSKHSSWQIYDTSNTPIKNNRIRQIIVSGTKPAWVGTYGDGLYRITNGQWEKVGLPFLGDYILSLKTDSSSGLWVGTARNGAYCLKKNIWIHYDTSNGLTDNNVWDLLPENATTTWFCSRYRGICIRQADRCSCITTAQGLSDREITCIAKDNSGALWIGTARGGVSGFHNNTWTYLYTKNGISGVYIRALICDSTLRWVGSWDGGLDYFENASWSHVKDIKPPVVVITLDRKKNLWIGTWGNGVYYQTSRGWKHILSNNSGLPDNYVIDIKFDDTNKAYFATSGGVAVCDTFQIH